MVQSVTSIAFFKGIEKKELYQKLVKRAGQNSTFFW